MHDYPAASKALARLSGAFQLDPPTDWYGSGEETILWPDPFVGMINDYPKVFGNIALSKAAFYYQLTTGVYQTGAFGNSWQLISYNWTSIDNYIKGTYYSGDYHEARQAVSWYEKARNLSNDPEFRAKCTFMLAKCEQKQYTFESVNEYYDQYYSDYYAGNKPDPFRPFSQHNPHFDELAKQYSHTAFFKRAVYECSYLSDFIN